MEHYSKPMVDNIKQEGRSTYELPEAIKACTRCVQNQARQNPSMKMGCRLDILPQDELLLVTDGCVEKESLFLQRYVPKRLPTLQ